MKDSVPQTPKRKNLSSAPSTSSKPSKVVKVDAAAAATMDDSQDEDLQPPSTPTKSTSSSKPVSTPSMSRSSKYDNAIGKYKVIVIDPLSAYVSVTTERPPTAISGSQGDHATAFLLYIQMVFSVIVDKPIRAGLVEELKKVFACLDLKFEDDVAQYFEEKKSEILSRGSLNAVVNLTKEASSFSSHIQSAKERLSSLAADPCIDKLLTVMNLFVNLPNQGQLETVLGDGRRAQEMLILQNAANHLITMANMMPLASFPSRLFDKKDEVRKRPINEKTAKEYLSKVDRFLLTIEQHEQERGLIFATQKSVSSAPEAILAKRRTSLSKKSQGKTEMTVFTDKIARNLGIEVSSEEIFPENSAPRSIIDIVATNLMLNIVKNMEALLFYPATFVEKAASSDSDSKSEPDSDSKSEPDSDSDSKSEPDSEAKEPEQESISLSPEEPDRNSNSAVLYKVLARHIVITMNCFVGLRKLNTKTLVTRFLSHFVTKQRWKDVGVDPVNLMAGMKTYANIDFASKDKKESHFFMCGGNDDYAQQKLKFDGLVFDDGLSSSPIIKESNSSDQSEVSEPDGGTKLDFDSAVDQSSSSSSSSAASPSPPSPPPVLSPTSSSSATSHSSSGPDLG